MLEYKKHVCLHSVACSLQEVLGHDWTLFCVGYTILPFSSMFVLYSMFSLNSKANQTGMT